MTCFYVCCLYAKHRRHIIVNDINTIPASIPSKTREKDEKNQNRTTATVPRQLNGMFERTKNPTNHRKWKLFHVPVLPWNTNEIVDTKSMCNMVLS